MSIEGGFKLAVARNIEEPERKEPLEKGFDRIEPRVRSGQQSLSQTIEKAASKVEQTGASFATKTGNIEQNAFNTVGKYLRSSSDYIKNADVRDEMNKAATQVRKDPMRAIYIAAGIGAALGLLVAIRRR
jgi:ElaB/YqjD/DUF883 family membrane-anchored ribosome-binding protein